MIASTRKGRPSGQLTVRRVLRQALPDHWPEGAADELPEAHRLSASVAHLDLPDDRREPGVSS